MKNPFLAEILGEEPIPRGKLAYFRQRLRNNLHNEFLIAFSRLEKEGNITREKLAARIGCSLWQLNQWLGSKLTLDIASDLMLAMKCELNISTIDLSPTPGPNNLGDKYLAFVLDEESRAAVLSAFAPKFERVIAHHITIDFNPEKLSNKDLDMFLKITTAEVVGYASDDSLECLVCLCDETLIRSDDSMYHITLSLQSHRKPVQSNDLLKSVDVETIPATIKLSGKTFLLPK